MDDNTFKALTALADKLGTTAEHLWDVLLRQAPVSAITSLGCCFFALIVVSMLTFFVHRAMRNCEDEDLIIGRWIGTAVVWLFVLIFMGDKIPEIVQGLVHPEYWALKQLLR